MAQLCSRHADRAFALVLDDAVNDRGLAMTSSFTNMVLAGQCVGHLEDDAQFGEVVAQLCETGLRFLPVAAEAAAAITLLGCTRSCFVGAGVLRAVADESALKVVGTQRRQSHDSGGDAAGVTSRSDCRVSTDRRCLWLSCRARRGGAATNLICCERSIASGWDGCERWLRRAEAKMRLHWWITVCRWIAASTFPITFGRCWM